MAVQHDKHTREHKPACPVCGARDYDGQLIRFRRSSEHGWQQQVIRCQNCAPLAGPYWPGQHKERGL